MAEVLLSPGSPSLVLTNDNNAFYVVLRESENPRSPSFPVQYSLLKAVSDGYSYQVANEHGSLRIFLSDSMVEFRYEGGQEKNRKFALESSEFLLLLSEIGDR